MGPNPQTVAFVMFDPATGELIPGSWGARVVPGTPGVNFAVFLSPEYAGVLTADQAATLSILPTLHEINAGYTITPFGAAGVTPGGFNIDFGAAVVRTITIKVEKLAGGR